MLHQFDSEPNHQHGFFFFCSSRKWVWYAPYFQTNNLVKVRLWIFYLYFYLFYLRESRQRMEFLTFLQWDEHSVFSECRCSSEDGWLFEKFDICRRQFPQRGVWMGGTNTTAAQWGWVCPAGAPTDWWRWGGNTDAKNSELRRRIGSGRRAGLSAGLSRSTGTQKKERIFVSRLWLRMDDFALLVSPTVLLSPPLCVSFCHSHSHSPIFFSYPEQTQHGRRRRRRDRRKRRKKRKTGRNRSLEDVAGSYFTQMFEFSRRCVDLEALLSILAPPPRPPLLANHGATPLYLGHCDVLPLSPMADALCRNLRKKIGWGGGEERGEELHRSRERLSLVPPKKEKLKLPLLWFPPNREYLLLSRFPSPPISRLYLPLRVNCEERPPASAGAPLCLFSPNLIHAVTEPFTSPFSTLRLWQRFWKKTRWLRLCGPRDRGCDRIFKVFYVYIFLHMYQYQFQ